MDSDCRKALQMLEENDPVLTELRVVDWKGMPSKPSIHTGKFNSTNSNDYARLGEAIAMNTHLTKLHVNDETILDVSERGFHGFYDGLKRNSSIIDVSLWCDCDLIGSVYHDILKAYQNQENICRLTHLRIDSANLQNGGEHLIVSTLQRCTNLKDICLFCCNVTDEKLVVIVEAVRVCRSLEKLELSTTYSIGSTLHSCEILAGLLTDTNCNLESLALRNNEIDNEGVTVIANSLSNNTKLQNLDLYNNHFDTTTSFSRLVCDTSSINSTYYSNHTLVGLGRYLSIDPHLKTLLEMNTGTNKRHVAMKKILRSHPNIDMAPLFTLCLEEGERNLKALPYVIDWFDTASAAIDDEEVHSSVSSDDSSDYSDSDDSSDNYDYEVEEKKLTAIYEFALAMPVLFIPASHTTVDDDGNKKKRKRG